MHTDTTTEKTPRAKARAAAAAIALFAALLAACLAAACIPAQDAHAVAGQPSTWSEQGESGGVQYKLGLTKLRIQSQTATTATLAVDVWTASSETFSKSCTAEFYVDGWSKGSKTFTAKNTGGWLQGSSTNCMKNTTWTVQVSKDVSARTLSVEADFSIGGETLSGAYSNSVKVPAADKVYDLSDGSLSVSPSSPEVGDVLRPSFRLSGVSTASLNVFWWVGNDWSTAVSAGSSSYSSASYAVKASDVGKRIWCQVRGTTSATTGEKHVATAAVQAADPDVPSAGASFYYTADSTVEKVSGSGMRVEMKGEAAPTGYPVGDKRLCTVAFPTRGSGSFRITNVSTSAREPGPKNTYDIVVSASGMAYQGSGLEAPFPGVRDEPVYFGFAPATTYPSDGEFGSPNEPGDPVAVWMKGWYHRADLSVKVCKPGSTSGVSGYRAWARVSDIDIAPGYTINDAGEPQIPVSTVGPSALYNGFEFVRAGSSTSAYVTSDSILQQDYAGKAVYAPKTGEQDLTGDNRFAARIEGTSSNGTLNLTYGGTDCGINLNFGYIAAGKPLASPQPWIVKKASPASVYEGETVTFTLEAYNKAGSETAAADFTITDTMPAGLSLVRASAALVAGGSTLDGDTVGRPQVSTSGDSVTVTQARLGGSDKVRVTIVARADGTATGTVRNWAYAKCTGGAQDSHYADVTVKERPRASLYVHKTADVSEVEPGGEVAWKITVSNDSDTAAEGVVLADALPAGFEYESADKGDVSGGRLTYSHGTLAPGASFTVVVEGKAAASAAGTTLRNTASATCSNGSGGEDEASVDVKEVPALSVEKTSDAPSYTVGDTVRWTVAVRNDVSGTVARDVVVTDEVPAGVRVDSVSASCDDAAAKVFAANDGNSVRATCDALPYGKTLVLEIEGTAVAAGTLTNAAKAESSNGSPGEDESTVTVEEPPARLEISKTALGGPYAVGDVVSYDVLVANVSDADAKDVTVSDELPAELEPIWCSLGSFAGNAWTYEAETLPAGKTISVRIQAKAIAEGEVVNTARADASNGDPVEDDETVTVSPAPEYALSKTADKDVYAPGETIRWTVTLTRAEDTAAKAAARGAGLLPESDAGLSTPSPEAVLEKGAVGRAKNVPAEAAAQASEAAPANGAIAPASALAKGDAAVLAVDGEPEIEPVAFAVYSADDRSLSFYKRWDVPTAGDTFEGKTATEVYTGFETEEYGLETAPPWNEEKFSIESVSVVDEGIAPISTANWFELFQSCTSMDLAKLDTGKTENMSLMFSSCSSLESLDLSSFDTSNVTDMDAMFLVCRSLVSINLADWDVSNVASMRRMFESCESLESLDLSCWNTNSLKDASTMFAACYSLKTLDLSSFDTSNVTDMSLMFPGGLETIVLGEKFAWVGANGYLPHPSFYPGFVLPDGYHGKWYAESDGAGYAPEDVPSNKADTYHADIRKTPQTFAVYSADDRSLNFYKRSGMPAPGEAFDGRTATESFMGFEKNRYDRDTPWQIQAPSIESVSVVDEGIAPISTANWFELFQSCTSMDLANLDTSTTDDMSGTFSGCSSLKTLDLSSFDTSNVADMNYMFYGCRSLEKVVLGEKFAWVGADGYLPAPDPWPIPGADGKWYAESDGAGYAPEDVPSNKADTYHADISKTPQTFAVYSADDRSLNFYKRSGMPKMGDVFEGKTATEVYMGFEIEEYSYASRLPWYDEGRFVEAVTVVDSGIVPISTASWFRDFSYCTSMDLAKLDTSKTANMAGMFSGCSSLSTIDLSSWDTSNVTEAFGLFDACSSLEKAILGEKFAFFFGGYLPANGSEGLWYAESDRVGYAPEDIPSNKADTYYASKDLLPKAAFAVYSADDKSLNFYKRDDMPKAGDTFEGKTATKVYTGFETEAAVPWKSMNGNIKSVSVVDEGISPVSTASWFSACFGCTSMDLAKLDTSKTASMREMFRNSSVLASLDLSGWDTSSAKDMGSMFATCYSLESLDLSGWDTSNVENMGSMFYSCPELATLDLSSFDTSNVTNMVGMFGVCGSLENIDLSGFDTSNVTNMSQMFYDDWAIDLAAAGVPSFDTSNVTNMEKMFYNCRSSESIDLSGFDTSNVTNMYGMFNSCSELATLDLSSFDTSNVTNMANMFYNCSSLEKAVLGEKFAWKGGNGYLPVPDPSFIPGADGLWRAESDGSAYAPADIPSNKADTYYASKGLMPQPKAMVEDLLQPAGVLDPANSTGSAFAPAGAFLKAALGEAALAPGESASWTVTAVVGDDAPDTITNAAIATLPDSSEKRAESTVAVVRPAQLEMTKSSEDEVYAVGETVHWNVELSNVGGTPAFGWAIADALPANVEFVSATLSVDGALKASFDAEQESYSVHDAATQAGALAPWSSAVLHVAAKAVAEGEAVNHAVGSADGSETVEAEDPVEIEKPTVDIDKTADKTVYNVGDVVTYTISVENSSAHAAYNVVVTDTLPAELEFVSATAGEIVNGTLTWNVGTMAPGSERSVQVKAAAKAAGAVANKATVSVEGCDPNESEEVVDVLEPVLSVVKTASAESAEPGDALTWTIEVRNTTEGSTAYNVVVEDALPAGFIAESCDEGRLEGGRFVWEVGDLAFGQPAEATISGHIDPGFEGALVNTAVATSDNSDPAEGSDTVSAGGEVTVTFVVDVSEMLPQGEKVFEQVVKKGEDYAVGPEADAAGRRDGCARFDGWFLDPECTEPYTGGPVGDNLTLYGKNYARIGYAWSALSKFPGETEPQYKAPAASAENLIWIGYELPLYDEAGNQTSDGTGSPSVEVAYGERYELPAVADPVRYTWGGMAWIEYQAQFWHAREDLSDAALTPAGERPFATGDATWWCKVAKGRYDGVIG